MPGYVDERKIVEWEDEFQRSFDRMLGEMWHRVVAMTANRHAGLTAAALPIPEWNGDHYSLVDAEWWKSAARKRLRPKVAEAQLRTGLNVAAQLGFTFDLHNPLVTAAIDTQSALLEQYGEALREQVGDILRQAEHDGLSIENTARQLRETGAFSPAEATRLARTEIVAASNNGAITAVRAAGVETHPYKRWLATEDPRTRLSHQAADGQQVLMDHRFTVGGVECDHPGDVVLPARERANCRCRVVFDRKQA